MVFILRNRINYTTTNCILQIITRRCLWCCLWSRCWCCLWSRCWCCHRCWRWRICLCWSSHTWCCRSCINLQNTAHYSNHCSYKGYCKYYTKFICRCHISHFLRYFKYLMLLSDLDLFAEFSKSYYGRRRFKQKDLSLSSWKNGFA